MSSSTVIELQKEVNNLAHNRLGQCLYRYHCQFYYGRQWKLKKRLIDDLRNQKGNPIITTRNECMQKYGRPYTNICVYDNKRFLLFILDKWPKYFVYKPYI